jgi:hypothetical protein
MLGSGWLKALDCRKAAWPCRRSGIVIKPRHNQGMRSPAPVLSGPLAAVDMGSNSFRLEIGQLQHGRYRRIDYLKETVRLGGGLDADGMLT